MNDETSFFFKSFVGWETTTTLLRKIHDTENVMVSLKNLDKRRLFIMNARAHTQFCPFHARLSRDNLLRVANEQQMRGISVCVCVKCGSFWLMEVLDCRKKKLRIMWSWIDIACIVRAFSLLFRQGCSHICFPMTLKFTHSSFGLESQSFSKFPWGLVWRTLFAGVWYAATSYLPQNTMRSHARQK